MNAVFDRLEAAASRLSTVRAMKLDEEMAGEASEREKRQALAREQLAAVDALLAENDRAITEMDKVTASLSDMKAQGDRVSTDLGLLMKDLEELAERTKKFKQ